MKSKEYLFTESEMLIIREALIEYKLMLQDKDKAKREEEPWKELVETAIRYRSQLEALARQFVTDCRNI